MTETTEVAKEETTGNDYKNHYKVDVISRRRAVNRDYRAPSPQSDKQTKQSPVLSLDSLIKTEAKSRKGSRQKPTPSTQDDASDEPLIIEAEVEGYLVRRVYVDEGSSVEVMFEHCFENVPAKVRAGLRETRTDLVGFAGEVAKPLGVKSIGSLFWMKSERKCPLNFSRPRPLSLQHNLRKTRFESTTCYSIDCPLNDQVPHSERNGNSGDPGKDNRRVQTSRRKANTDGEATRNL
ncbi:hypothetical protein Tco_0915808 [Tanacetum coccineum]